MSKGLRLSEKWFRRGLWLVALVFASFLVGLGGTLVGDLPKLEMQLTTEDFIDKAAAAPVRATIAAATQDERKVATAVQQAQLKRDVAGSAYTASRETFDNWLATRRATQLSDQDPELIARTRALDGLKAEESKAQAAVDALEQAALDAHQALEAAQEKLEPLERDAQVLLDAEYRKVELRVFLYRLALTLPLLAIAGWLFVKKRKSTYWPFVWGFIFFAAFTFFVELVPYLPSYGGYVRYAVGIIVTIVVGRQAIISLNRYLERQKLAEQMPDQVRREELSYDTALTRLSKGVCPGCERPVDLKNTAIDFCPHCGICLFDHCVKCTTRKSAFAKFCHACGVGSARGLLPPLEEKSVAGAPGLP